MTPNVAPVALEVQEYKMNAPYRKFIEKIDVSEWDVLSDKGFVPIKTIGKTVEYDVWKVKTESGKELKCADTHILFDTEFDEIFAKDLNKDTRPDYIQTDNGPELVVSVENTHVKKNMFDLEVDSKSHRYFTNHFLSHNSIFLCNDAVNFVLSGKNVVFITCEMSAKKVIKRMGAHMLDINIDNYDRESIDTDLITKKLSDVRQKQITPVGQLFVKEYPTSCCTTIDVESYVKQIQEVHGFKVHVVVIDYINIMANYRNPRSDDMYIKIKQISEDLRAIAVRQQCLILTATQTNRSAFDTNDITLSNIAESAGLIHTADTMFGIIQDADMRAENLYQLKVLKIRDGEGKNTKLELRIDYKKMRITETGIIYREDSNEPIALADAVRTYKNVKSNPVSENAKFNLDNEIKSEELW